MSTAIRATCSFLIRWFRILRPKMALIILLPFCVAAAVTSLYGTWSYPLGNYILATIIGLHSLANLANDYGDSQRALVPPRESDAEGRLVQAGLFSGGEVRGAMLIIFVFTLYTGLRALMHSQVSPLAQLCLGGLGLLSIWASIAYSMGRKPYSALGLGDVSVFLFFGLLNVLGTLYLQLHRLPWPTLLPATAMGLLSTSLMNLNNLRDFEVDGLESKETLARRLGFRYAQVYQQVLLMLPIPLLLLFSWLTSSWGGWFSLPMCGYLPSLLKKLGKATEISAITVYRPLFVQCIYWIMGIDILFILGCLLTPICSNALCPYGTL